MMYYYDTIRYMITDEVTLKISAGKGGNGKVSFRRAKYIPRGGPDGGNGGKGGDVYIEGVTDLSALNSYASLHEIKADDGHPGQSKKMYGRNAEDLTLKLPIGTQIIDTETGEVIDVTKAGERLLFLKGGWGGKGNFEFRSATRQAPDFAEEGKPGKSKTVMLSLQYIADIGLIGLPNAGKTSLLNALTKAGAKVGAYPFTTPEPNLGVLHGKVLADIPGLIEGAHEGKGLGIRFLKHIKKTRLLLHCIDVTTEDPKGVYKQIRNELEEFGEGLTDKPEIILLTKTDEATPDQIKKAEKALKSTKRLILPCSVLDETSMKVVTKAILEG